jgi:hypothetical protein
MSAAETWAKGHQKKKAPAMCVGEPKQRHLAEQNWRLACNTIFRTDAVTEAPDFGHRFVVLQHFLTHSAWTPWFQGEISHKVFSHLSLISTALNAI